MSSIKEDLFLFETGISCECVITNAILYTVYSRSQDKLYLNIHHSTVNRSTVSIVLTKFDGLFHKWPVHNSAPVHIISLLSLSCRRFQILFIVVWRKLWISGLWGPPKLPLFRNDLGEGLYCSLIEGILYVIIVTIIATELCIFGSGGVSFHSSTDI